MAILKDTIIDSLVLNNSYYGDVIGNLSGTSRSAVCFTQTNIGNSNTPIYFDSNGMPSAVSAISQYMYSYSTGGNIQQTINRSGITLHINMKANTPVTPSVNYTNSYIISTDCWTHLDYNNQIISYYDSSIDGTSFPFYEFFYRMNFTLPTEYYLAKDIYVSVSADRANTVIEFDHPCGALQTNTHCPWYFKRLYFNNISDYSIDLKIRVQALTNTWPVYKKVIIDGSYYGKTSTDHNSVLDVATITLNPHQSYNFILTKYIDKSKPDDPSIPNVGETQITLNFIKEI